MAANQASKPIRTSRILVVFSDLSVVSNCGGDGVFDMDLSIASGCDFIAPEADLRADL